MEVRELGPYILPPDKMLCIKFVIRIRAEQMMSLLQYGMMSVCAFSRTSTVDTELVA